MLLSVFNMPEETIEMVTERPTPRERQCPNDENLNLSAKEVCKVILFKIKERFVFKTISVEQRCFISNTSMNISKIPCSLFFNALTLIGKHFYISELKVFLL